MIIISEIQVRFQKFQLCWARKPEIFPLSKFCEFWWGSDEKSPFCWITWQGMTHWLPLLQPLRWCCVDCVIHHERDVREEQKYMYVARTSNNRVISSGDLYCWLLPRCEALRTCRSRFPIATPLCEGVGSQNRKVRGPKFCSWSRNRIFYLWQWNPGCLGGTCKVSRHFW